MFAEENHELMELIMKFVSNFEKSSDKIDKCLKEINEINRRLKVLEKISNIN